MHAAKSGIRDLKSLVERVKEGWNNSVPLLGPRPQPDYVVGFKQTAFTEEQLARVGPIIGNIAEDSSWPPSACTSLS